MIPINKVYHTSNMYNTNFLFHSSHEGASRFELTDAATLLKNECGVRSDHVLSKSSATHLFDNHVLAHFPHDFPFHG